MSNNEAENFGEEQNSDSTTSFGSTVQSDRVSHLDSSSIKLLSNARRSVMRPIIPPPTGLAQGSTTEVAVISDSSTGLNNIDSLVEALELAGLTIEDPRLKETRDNINKFNGNTQDIDKDEFSDIIKDNIELIHRALSKSLIIPDFKSFTEDLTSLFNKCRSNKLGKNANYIPQLERYDPNNWGMSVCTIDGQRFSIGDSTMPFTMQSTSKPFSYAMALSEYGKDYVHRFIGREPSGRFFNEISLDDKKKPHNPMINAGAIMSIALLKPEMNLCDRFDWIQNVLAEAAGGQRLSFNNSVFLSERENADRNFALAYARKWSIPRKCTW
jgi:glutaminase